MNEEIKKEIEELEKNFKKEEKETFEETVISKKASFSLFSSNFIVFLGIVLSLTFILLGLFFLYKFLIIKNKPIEESLTKGKSESLELKSGLDNQTFNQTSFYAKEKIKIPALEPNYPYKLELKNFLVSLDAKNFLKLDIIFYFEKDSELKSAMDNELIYRNFIFKFLATVEAKNWKNEGYIKEMEKRLIYEMEKRGLNPLPKAVELEGVLLKA